MATSTAEKTIPVRRRLPDSGPRSFYFGPELRELRGDKPLLPTATGIGIYPSTLMRLEKGDRGAMPDIVTKIERYYGVRTVEISRPEPPPNPG
jgi:hypothetical protein